MSAGYFCNMAALTAAQRERHTDLARQLRGALIRIRALPNGYAVELPGSAETMLRAAEFLWLERQCCPFFTLALRATGNDGPLQLRITGGADIKPFIRAEFGFTEEQIHAD